MMMKYFYLSQHPKVFLKMTGLRVNEFDKLLTDVLPEFLEAEESRLDRADRQRELGGGDEQNWKCAIKFC